MAAAHRARGTFRNRCLASMVVVNALWAALAAQLAHAPGCPRVAAADRRPDRRAQVRLSRWIRGDAHPVQQFSAPTRPLRPPDLAFL